MSKRYNLFELIQKFGEHIKTSQTLTIDKNNYVVVSHYVGNKDINEILKNLAIKTAYSELQN